MRVFDDGHGFASIWVEFQPDRFWCGDNEADARDHYRAAVSRGVTESDLRTAFGDTLRLVESTAPRAKGEA